MLLECAHCGAPLDVRAGVATSKCRYCGSVSRVERLRTIAPQTPPNWQPPPRWRPPHHVPADSNIELRYHGASAAALIGVVVGLFVLGGTIAVVAFAASKRKLPMFPGSGGGKAGAIDPQKLEDAPLTITKSSFQSKVGGQPFSDRWIRVDLASGPFEYIMFQWDPKEPGHVSNIGLHRSAQSCTKAHEKIRDGLKKDLGARFRGTSWHWDPTHLNFSESCSHLGIHASVDQQNWKPAFTALWKLVRFHVFDLGDKPKGNELDGYLARGYPLATLAGPISTANVDDAQSLAKQFPGANLRIIAGLRITFPIRHAQLGSVEAEYENKKGGGLRGLLFRAHDNDLDDREGLATCTAKELGAPLEVQETDYVKKKKSMSVRLKGGTVQFSESLVSAYAYGFNSFSAPVAQAVLDAIARCGKS